MSIVSKEYGVMEFQYSWAEWKLFKSLIEMNDGSVASALQTQIESGEIKSLDEVIQWAHLGESIIKNPHWESNHEINRGFVKLSQAPHP